MNGYSARRAPRVLRRSAGRLSSNTARIMLWILLSLLFLWCAFREVRASIVAPPDFDSPRPVSKPYLATVLVLAALFAWPPLYRCTLNTSSPQGLRDARHSLATAARSLWALNVRSMASTVL
jgi:hypothetical protein